MKVFSKKVSTITKYNYKNKINLGIIGFGRIGRVHAEGILANPRIELAGVAELNPEKFSEEERDKYKITTLNNLINKKLQGLVICSNTQHHVEHILFGLNNNLPIFVEKPVSFKDTEVKKCFDKATEKNLPLFCGFTRRFDPSLKEMVSELKKGYVGKIHLIRANFRDYPPPSTSNLVGMGSFIEDCGVHDIDFINHIVDPNGDNPIINTWARGESFIPEYKAAKVDDTCCVFLKYRNGEMVIIDLTRKANCGYDISCEVIGEKGMLLQKSPKSSTLVKWDHDGIKSPIRTYSYPQTFKQAFYNEIDEFVDICEKHANHEYTPKILPVSERDCIMTAKISTLCEKVRQEQVNSKGRVDKVSNEKVALYPHPIDFNCSDKVGIALFGTGSMGRLFGEELRKRRDIELVYTMSRHPELDNFGKEFGCKTLKTNDENLKLILSDKKIKAAVICNKSQDHYDLITKCIPAGKHLFVEKPLTTSYETTLKSVELSKKHKVILYQAFQRLWDPSHINIKNSIRANEIESIRITSRDGKNMQEDSFSTNSNSYVYDSVIHDIDMARWLTQENPFEVFCSMSSYSSSDNKVNKSTNGDNNVKSGTDAISAFLRFPSGVICSIDNHRAATYGYDQRLDVHCKNQNVSMSNYQIDNSVISTHSGISLRPNLPSYLQRYELAYRNELFHFIDLVQGKEKVPRVSLEDCLENAKIADAFLESIKTGKGVLL